MARYIGPRLRIIRRLGELPALTNKVPRKKNPPGQHIKKQQRPTLSSYKVRLLEKQKLRFNYGIGEKQLLIYVKKARRKKGSTGFFLMQFLEMRLDTLIFRVGFANTLPGARQLVNHGHICVNSKSVNIPSFQCKPGDIITVQQSPNSIQLINSNQQKSQTVNFPNHLEVDKNIKKFVVKEFVDKNNLSFKVDELLIVEYYSRIL